MMLSFILIGLGLLSVALGEDSPTIVVAPKSKMVVENGIVSFFCLASGDPTPRVYWQKNGAEMTTTNKRYTIVDGQGGSMLRITRVWMWDSGVIECVADNGVGEQASSSFKLDVYAENDVPEGYPQIVDHPTDEAVWEHQDAEMSCSAKGNPEVQITWLKDFLPVDISDPRIDVTTSGSLLIHNTRESDEGKYECVAENNVGVSYSHTATLLIRIRRVPLHFTTRPQNVGVKPGGDVNLVCAAAGSPKPYVEWFHGDINLTPAGDVPIGENTLTLTNIRESTVYNCEAWSDQGRIKTSLAVIVETDRSRMLRKINRTKWVFA